jgi:formate hydrogenlyase subunit 4
MLNKYNDFRIFFSLFKNSVGLYLEESGSHFQLIQMGHSVRIQEVTTLMQSLFLLLSIVYSNQAATINATNCLGSCAVVTILTAMTKHLMEAT